MALSSFVNWSSSLASFRVPFLGRLYLMTSACFLGCVRRAGKLTSSWRPFLRMFSG